MGDRSGGLRALLTTDPRDAGCEETWHLIDVYAELVLAGNDPDHTLPGITAHLESCDPCGEDYRGLLSLMRTASEQRT
ncbi:hypothetical protein [Microlunatus antarcticus]|uniref:Zinc-finger n=1 Tax=Microlunatus antarcticus TaxID=53388 RepID=A0A7W5JVF7_9ACTN|nr:hypothetical protein [Microlunatus antarcticus]MBB3326973.1 hypothetical protein [Microlunatus antarcticus]